MPKGETPWRRARRTDASKPRSRSEPPPPLDRLNPERLAGFLELALVPADLLRLCRTLGLSTPGYRLEKLASPDHAALLADAFVETEARAAIEDAVTHALKSPALRTMWLTSVAARELAQMVVADPLTSAARLAWRFMGDGDPGVKAAAERAIDAGLMLLEGYEDQAEAPPAAAPEAPAAAAEAGEELQRKVTRAERDREAARALLQQARTEIAERDRRLNEVKAELANLRVESAQRAAEISRLTASRSTEERRGAHETRKAAAERAQQEHRTTELEERLVEERRRIADLERQLAREKEKPGAAPPPVEAEPEVDAASVADFVVPHFTREFYDSLDGWDRRIVKSAFEKVLLLARDRRHPSLRALPLEGIENYWRIRIATDVRLIYRRASDGRVEVLSLIDREDLDRYIRQAKTRRES